MEKKIASTDAVALTINKQNQKKKKIDEEVCPQIKNKVQESSCQLSWNILRVQYGAYKSSYVDKHFHIHNIPNWKESTLLLWVENKSFDRYYIKALTSEMSKKLYFTP